MNLVGQIKVIQLLPPESKYNTKTREMLIITQDDDYYPRALQLCSTEEKPDNLVNIDISKCYPSILLNNTHPIPVYTIHDIIEPFSCRNDETVIESFGYPVKTEAGFYSSNLIWYLVNDLHMSTSKIKYKIIAKQALEPKTFHNYLIFRLKTFAESQAKLLVNSFIGELGRKYSRTDHGFTCRDMDIAQCIWTSDLAQGRNVTIDNYKDLYLSREQTVERIFSDNTGINRFVISQSIVETLQLIFDNYRKDSILYSVNTDGFKMSNRKNTYQNKKDVKFKVKPYRQTICNRL